LLKEKCPWHLEGNHTTEQCYQLRRALEDSPDPRPPHDKKGKKKADEGNDDFQEPDKTVNVLFGRLPDEESLLWICTRLFRWTFNLFKVQLQELVRDN
jgi:hypothetical protein